MKSAWTACIGLFSATTVASESRAAIRSSTNDALSLQSSRNPSSSSSWLSPPPPCGFERGPRISSAHCARNRLRYNEKIWVSGAVTTDGCWSRRSCIHVVPLRGLP